MAGIVARNITTFADRGVVPCGKFFCMCVEYLDFGNREDEKRYKNCYITYENNLKYKKEKKEEKEETLYNRYDYGYNHEIIQHERYQ